MSDDFAIYEEENDWEGETWRWYIPVAGNETALASLGARLQTFDGGAYRLVGTIPEAEARTLCKHSGSGHLTFHNLLVGRLKVDVLLTLSDDALTDTLYKGHITKFVTKPVTP